MRFIKLLLILVLFVLGWMFFIQNTEMMQTKVALNFELFTIFKWQSAEVPYYAVVIVAFGVGMLFSLVSLLVDRIRLSCALMGRKRAERILQRQVEDLKAQVDKNTKIIDARATEVKELPTGSPAAGTAKA